ncbi:hypothetical protein C3L33_03491, partial [Rhododendron williamsianum]
MNAVQLNSNSIRVWYEFMRIKATDEFLFHKLDIIDVSSPLKSWSAFKIVFSCVARNRFETSELLLANRLLPYHVVADYEAEEDDRILDSDTTGQMLSRSQQWDHNIAAKVAEFTATFEKQALAFNIISRKRSVGEFRSEERLMIEQALLQEERKAMFELRAEMEKAGREAHEAKLRMAAMVKAEQTRAAESHMARAPIRASALGSHGSGDLGIGDDEMLGEDEEGDNPDVNEWGSNAQREEREPSEDFLNDEETENGETSMQHEWRDVGEFDLNTR